MSYLSLGGGGEEDGDFFGSPVGGPSSSRLGSLFGMNAKMDRDPTSNQSLTYTAPKPPKQGKPAGAPNEGKSSAPQPASGVAIAVAVTAYRYINNQYQKQGKLGAALLSNHADKDYKILMYVSKQQPVTAAKITSEFQFNTQPNNYASFYDDQRQMWSVLFDSSEQLISFAKQVCLAKFNSSDASRTVSQELALGEGDGPPVESGDSIEAKYTGWLVQNCAFGAVFDSNHKTDKTFRFKTGKGKVIKGWDQGMIGMKKGGKRFLIIPPSLAYGAKGAGGRVPPNSTLAFEVDVLRVKHAKGSVQNSNSVESVPQAVAPPEPSFAATAEAPFSGSPLPGANDESVKGRTASINEQLSHTIQPQDTNKARLVSRMAKMGHAMLPQSAVPAPDTQMQDQAHPHQPPATSPGVNMSHTPPQPQVQSNEGMQVRMAQSPAYSNSSSPMMEQPYIHHPHAVAYQQSVPAHAVSIQPQGQVVGLPQNHFLPPSASPFQGALGSYQTPFPQQYAMGAGSELLPSILNESRQQTAEMKVLLEKMDKVSEKMEEMKKASTESKQNFESMDGPLLSHNINRIIQVGRPLVFYDLS